MRAAGRVAILIGVVALGVGACRGSRPAVGSGAAVDARTGAAVAGPAVILNAGGRRIAIRVELATTDAQRERGLMYRNHLDPDSGMLFIFDRDAPLTFWMKNTLIPLDMIFIGSDRKIVGIVENATPETENPRGVTGMSRYVLEIAGGMSRRLGVTAGGAVEFQGVAAAIQGD